MRPRQVQITWVGVDFLPVRTDAAPGHTPRAGVILGNSENCQQGLLIVRERKTQELQSRRGMPAVMPQRRRDVALAGQAQQSEDQVA